MDLGWVADARPTSTAYDRAEELLALDGFGEVSARKLFDAIEASKAQPFGRVLFAVGIEEVGDVTGRNLAQQFRTIDALLDADAGGARADAGRRAEDGSRRSMTQLADPPMRDADRGSARRWASRSRRRGPARRGAAGGADVRAHRHAARPHARAGERDDHGRRRQGHRLGLTQDQLRRRRRERRLEARQAPSGWVCRCSTRPGCGRCCLTAYAALRAGDRPR